MFAAGAAAGFSLALTLHGIISSENRMLREEQQICRVERADRSIDRAITRAARVSVQIPPAPGC